MNLFPLNRQLVDIVTPLTRIQTRDDSVVTQPPPTCHLHHFSPKADSVTNDSVLITQPTKNSINKTPHQLSFTNWQVDSKIKLFLTVRAYRKGTSRTRF